MTFLCRFCKAFYFQFILLHFLGVFAFAEIAQLPTREIDRSQIIPLHMYTLQISSNLAIPINRDWRYPVVDGINFIAPFLFPNFPTFSPLKGLQFPIWPIPVYAQYGLFRHVENQDGVEVLRGSELIIEGGIQKFGAFYSQKEDFQFSIGYGVGINAKTPLNDNIWTQIGYKVFIENLDHIDNIFIGNLGLQVSDNFSISPSAKFTLRTIFNPDSVSEHMYYSGLLGLNSIWNRSSYNSLWLSPGVSITSSKRVSATVSLGCIWQWHKREKIASL